MTFLETQRNTRAETFSLSFNAQQWAERTVIEPHLSEQPQEIVPASASLRQNRGSTEGDVNDPLCPLLPSVKRNINNKLAMHLEGNINDRRLTQ